MGTSETLCASSVRLAIVGRSSSFVVELRDREFFVAEAILDIARDVQLLNLGVVDEKVVGSAAAGA